MFKHFFLLKTLFIVSMCYAVACDIDYLGEKIGTKLYNKELPNEDDVSELLDAAHNSVQQKGKCEYTLEEMIEKILGVAVDEEMTNAFLDSLKEQRQSNDVKAKALYAVHLAI
jgi:hypothetical protein